MIKRKWRFLIGLGALFSPALVGAQQQEYTIHGTEIRVKVDVQQTAGQLFDQCNFDPSAPAPPAFICVGYLAGAEDGMRIIWAANNLPSAFCKPEGTERDSLLKVVVDFVRAHPEKRELPAALAILQAYREAFPCAAIKPK